jgi:hypothetical protein
LEKTFCDGAASGAAPSLEISGLPTEIATPRSAR